MNERLTHTRAFRIGKTIDNVYLYVCVCGGKIGASGKLEVFVCQQLWR